MEKLSEISDEDARAEGYKNAAAFLAGPWAQEKRAEFGDPLVWVFTFTVLPS